MQTILIVEDEEPIRNFLTRVLKMQGYTPLPAANGPEALVIACDPAQAIDLVVTDVLMPSMNGKQLVQELNKQRPDLKAIFVSGYSPEDLDASLSPGADAVFLPKPFSREELMEKIRASLGQS